MPTITITIKDDDGDLSQLEVEGTHWTKDEDGNRYVYDDELDIDDPVAEISNGFEAILTRQ